MERDVLDPAAPGDITRLLDAWSHGDPDARDQLMPIVDGELRRQAAAYLRAAHAACSLYRLREIV